ncbi:Heterodimeric geranylgeranyl pyrophosphate synthase small subunit chloroplastic [Bienertia sinuspersici]
MASFSLTSSFHTFNLPTFRHSPQQRPLLSVQIKCSAHSSSSMPTTPSSTAQFNLRTYWTALIQEINHKLDESIPVSYPHRIYEAMRYTALDKAAKRAPPVMCITACELFGGHRTAAFPTACALEMVHAASLIHDDLPCMDNDQVRRGHAANHVVYGEDMAILAGDALFPLGFSHIVSYTPRELVPETRVLQVIAEIARTVGSTGMVAGQFLDLEDGADAVDFIQEKKFGELAECSAVCGGLLAGAIDDDIQRLRRYGKAVGILYQVVDDILKEKANSRRNDEEEKSKGKSYVRVYGLEKAKKVAEDLRAQAKKELDGFENYGDKVIPLYSFVDYAADRGFSVGA